MAFSKDFYLLFSGNCHRLGGDMCCLMRSELLKNCGKG